MIALFWFVLAILVLPFKSKSRLEAENMMLRHQLSVLRRQVSGRVQLTNGDRLFFVQLYRWFPSILNVVTIVRPETLLHWHRAGYRLYWRWKSRSRGGLCVPKTSSDSDFGFRGRNFLFLRGNSLFRRNNSLLFRVGNFAQMPCNH